MGFFFLNLWQSTFGVLWSKLDSSTSPSLDDARFPAILVDVDITYLYIYIYILYIQLFIYVYAHKFLV